MVTSATARTEKRSVALASVLAAVVMTALKLAAGLLTGSLGILSDAAHSALDLAGAALTWLSVSISDKPADEEHTYGHEKIENVSAFVETFLMVASSVWITTEAVIRIFYHPVVLRFTLWPAGVLVLSIVVDTWRSRRLRAVAARHGSSALEADAMHFASDIWSSAAVLAGLVAAWVGAHFGIGWLRLADPIAAIAVSGLIVRFAWRLAWRTVEALVDAIPAETRHRMLVEVQKIDGVLSVDKARMRRSGNSHFADLTISLSRQLTFQKTEELVREATEAVRRVLPGADVVIHPVPRAGGAESIFDKVRAVASRNNVMLHDVSIQSLGGKLHVEQHIEVNERLALREAHDFVRRIEDEIRQELPQVTSVLTHIESEPATIEEPVMAQLDRELEQHLRNAATQLPEVIDIHEVAVGRVGDKLQLSCHCTLPDELTMQRVHEVITALEDRFKLEAPEVQRVLIHPEPATDNHHH
ncbi:cation-efflux pump [Acidipila rosea]|uniref:Cation diffusion facilitator family transporter n=1 Tax=Acidipila rosea TaxID=768535 RepID=A0A4R1LCC9_9BACT|nr:cation-efflux pump [Acidipila rosea]MBW4026946.1 cation-efflux pump [Acidobacteriota bacterium]MBW4045014.1 cation-efflux pump [Acidobacteriota bacterium]TCK75247.1 cation diffusion facilitator family transporter [Acidipila rosea]